jgi:hypothetical protein
MSAGQCLSGNDKRNLVELACVVRSRLRRARVEALPLLNYLIDHVQQFEQPLRWKNATTTLIDLGEEVRQSWRSTMSTDVFHKVLSGPALSGSPSR